MNSETTEATVRYKGIGSAFVVLILIFTPFLIINFNAEIGAVLPMAELRSDHTRHLLLGVAVLFALGSFGMMVMQARARARSEALALNLRRSEASVAMEKERLAVTLDSIREGVITCDQDGRIVTVNHSAENLTGWLRTDAVGLPLEQVYNTIHEKTREPRQSPITNILRVGGLAGRESRTLLIAKDESERPVKDQVSRLMNREGQCVGAALVFRDVTEDRRTEEELLKESKLESVGKLAGGIAHDYNNILTGMIGNVSLARRSVNSPAAVLEKLQSIEKAAMRAKDLTQQLLTFSDGGAPVRRAMYVQGLVRDATHFALHGANVEGDLQLPDDLWPAEVDEGQFRQTMHNIVTNAVQAMPDGGKVVIRAENMEISPGVLQTMRGGKSLRITISDTGHGIQPKHLTKIFDPYFSTRENGSGLGLATAHSVIRKHGGHIEAFNRSEGGATIRIHIPASQKPVEDVHQPAEPNTEPATAAALNPAGDRTPKGPVLVMDDESDILTVISAMIEVHGYQADTARDGREALEKYQAAAASGRPFDAVIMDLTIPNGMGGKEAVQKLKAIDPKAKVIVSSGYSYDPVMSDYRKYGFAGVIPKPYRMEDLDKVLRQVINSAGTSGEVKQAPPTGEEVLSFGRIQKKLRAATTSREI